MNLEQFVEQLEVEEQTEYDALVAESQNGGDAKAVRGRLARLAVEVLKRLDQQPNPGPIIGEFNKLYAASQPQTPTQPPQPTEMLPIKSYPQMLVQPLTELEKTQDSASTHKALLDLGEVLLVYMTGIQFGEYRKYWEIDESIEAEFYKNAKRKPSFGVFLGFLRQLAKANGNSILDNLFQKNAQFPAVSEYVLAYDLLSQVINQGYDDNFQPQVDLLREGRTVAKRGVMNFYDSFISMRNSYAHPEDKAKNPERKWPLGEEYYDFINSYVQAGLEELIANLIVITEYKPFWVQNIDDNQKNSQVIVEIGAKGKKENISLDQDGLDFIDTEDRYLMDQQNKVFAKLYYNEIPQLAPSVAKKIVDQEKAKIMEPVLLEMIQQKMADGVIDAIEYMVLKDTAFTSSISEDRLKQLIETTKQAQGIEGDVIVQSKDEKIIPSLNPWWLYHFGWLDQSKVERSEDPLNKTNAHVALWKQVTSYLEYLVEQHLNNDLVQWKIKVNQYQIGALSYTYWAQIYPEVSPLDTYFSVGFAISKKYRWTKARKESGSLLIERFKKPAMVLWTSGDVKLGGDIDQDRNLWQKYETSSHDLLLRERDKLVEFNANVSGFLNNKLTVIPAKEYLDKYISNGEYHFEQLYSPVFNIEDFFEDGQASDRSTLQIEKQIISLMTLFSNSVLSAVDYAIENGINRETVKSLRDHAKRMEKQINDEIKARIEIDEDFDAIAYMRQRAEELRLSQWRLDNLIGKSSWRGYREKDKS